MPSPRSIVALTAACVTAGVCSVPASVLGADRLASIASEVSRSAETGKVSFVGNSGTSLTTATTGTAAQTGRTFLATHAAEFGLAGSTLAVVDETPLPGGGAAVRYQQSIGGVDVIAGQFVVHLDRSEGITLATGEGEPTEVATTPTIGGTLAEATATASVARTEKMSADSLRAATAVLRIYDSRLAGGDVTAGPQLVWSIAVNSDGPVHKQVLVSAVDGRIVVTLERAPGAKDREVCDAGNFNAQSPCEDTVLEEGGSYSGFVPDVTPAYQYAGATYDYFLSRFDRDSIDDDGMTIRSTVRFCANESASTCPMKNAYWSSDSHQMYYGDHYASADDVVGHELMHGITDDTSRLLYENESGAINESLSDVFGEFIDQATPSPNDASSDMWRIGESLPTGALRWMQNPPDYGDPDSMTSDLFVVGDDQDKIVHKNSGVGNKAAFLIAAGGDLHNIHVNGIGNEKAAQIYYRVATTILTEGSDYNALGRGLRAACDELVGSHAITQADCIEVRKAVRATEMVPPADPVADVAVSANGVRAGVPATFDASRSDDPDGAVLGYSWEASDGATGTGPTFTHTFAQAGSASVTVTIIDSQGDDGSKTRDFTVRRADSPFIDLPGCTENVLGRNDDSSSSLVDLPFQLNFFGAQRNALYVNNNGNVTFDSPLATFTPFDLSTTDRPIIAPFFGDVDTRASRSDEVRYGAATYAGRPAFCVNWDGVAGVGYFSSGSDKLNRVQLLLVDRSDQGMGDFDIYFNYDQVQWEAGSASGGSGGRGGQPARAGYANGTRDPSALFEIPGSGVAGAFLDSDPAGLISNSRGSSAAGRYLFPVRNGLPPGTGTIGGRVLSGSGTAAGAPVQACLTGTSTCVVTRTSSQGDYAAIGLAEGDYVLTAWPSNADRGHATATVRGVHVAAGEQVARDIALNTLSAAPPTGSAITSIGVIEGGTPVVDWGVPLSLTTRGCVGGTGTFVVTSDSATVRSGPMTADGSGYSATTPALRPVTGYVTVTMTVSNCPNPTDERTAAFGAYIDPSGRVLTVDGDPVPDAAVALSRSDTSAGPFEPVPDGSDLMAPSNRTNPDLSREDGRFGWDVIAGYYHVTASREGCHAPGAPDMAAAESDLLEIPPPVVDLDLRLVCSVTTDAPASQVFPETTIGNTSAVPIHVKTAGLGRLHTSSVSISGPGADSFAIVANSCAALNGVGPGDSCSILLAFGPTSGGSRSATLTIAGNAGNGSSVVELSGFGKAAAPQAPFSGDGGTLPPGGNQSGGGESSTGPGPTPDPLFGTARLAPTKKAIGVNKAGRMTLSIVCGGQGPCSGSLAVTAKRATKGQKSPAVYSTVSYSLRAGQSGTVSLKLSPQGSKRLKLAGKSSLKALAVIRPILGSITSTPIGLKATAPKAKRGRAAARNRRP